MESDKKTRVIQCPTHKRPVEVTYRTIGSWFNRSYDIQSCSAMEDGGGCDRQCRNQLLLSSRTDGWFARF